MIGLKRGSVRLFQHRTEWEQEAAHTIALLREIFGEAAAEIQHVGSTAVPSIKAKPIIDIAVGLRDMDEIDAYIAPLEAAGVFDRGEDHPGQRLFVMGDVAQNVITHHIHFCELNGEAFANYIRFRNFLRDSPSWAQAYEAVKLTLANAYAEDRTAYTEGKKDMIERILEEAKAAQARPKAFLICGRIACGKTVYAQKLCEKNHAVNLSCDELMLSIFGNTLGTRFDEVSGRCKRYLYNKALELLACGTNVVLDWGFWTPAERRYARKMFTEAGFDCELHYVFVSDEVWRKNIEIRNRLVAEGKCDAYPVDEGLLEKLKAGFHEPSSDEVDVFYDNNWC